MSWGWPEIWLGLTGLFAMLWAAGFLVPPPDPVKQLTALYVKLMRLGPVQGRVHLSLQLEKLRAKVPGQTEYWYLNRLVGELQRAKNRG